MRASIQLGVIAVLGASAFGAWSQWHRVGPVLAQVPGFAFVAPRPAPAGGQRGGPPVVVEVAAIGTGPIIEMAEAVGSTRAYESVALTAKVSGIVDKISFEEGQNVQAGDELVRFDAAERRADLEAARAAILTSRAKREETAQKLERALALRRTGAGTEAQVADLTAQVKTAETDVAVAEARERAAAARLDDLILRAPFGGRVGLRQVSLGALVDNKVVVTTLDDVSRMRLDFSVPETLIARVAVDSPIKAMSLAFSGRVFEGRVAVIDTRIDTVTRSAKVTAIIPNPDAALKPGMFLTVTLQVATRENAVLAPEEAIIAEGPRQIAFMVKDGRIERRVVSIGQRQAGMVEITEGIAAGEIIVVRGVQRVRQGMPVQTRPAFPGKDAPASSGNAPVNRGRKA